MRLYCVLNDKTPTLQRWGLSNHSMLTRHVLMASTNPINTPSKRQKLQCRREPHWFGFAKGHALGFRKLANGGSWIFKAKRKQTRISDVFEMSYDEALTRAHTLAKTVSDNVDTKMTLSLEQVLGKYRQKKAAETSEKQATQNHNRFLKILPRDMLDEIAIKITADQFNNWKYSRVLKIQPDDEGSSELLDKVRASKSTFNKDLALFMAALRHVYGQSYEGGWSCLKKFDQVDKGRTLFLTQAEIQKWILHSQGPFRQLSKGALLTGARIGELRALDVWQLEKLKDGGGYLLDIQKSKTGPRLQMLSNDAGQFFQSLCEGRDKNEPMFLNSEDGRWKLGEQVRELNKIKKIAELPDDTIFYSLRHYYVSRALLANFNILALSRNVGTSVLMIQKFYGKFLSADVLSMLNATKL